MTRGNGKEKQAAILDFIRKEVATRGYPPSVREIGDAIGVLSTSTVHGHLAKLERDGAIRRDPTKPRAIELVGEQRASATGRVPLLGKVTAGLPITAVQDVEDYIPLPPGVSERGDAIFALRISGQSMIDAGIHDGDIVYVERQSSARNGEIVVAMTEDGEATVKRFFQERDHIRLQPENSSMAPLLYDSVTILGRVVGLWRVIA